MDVKDDVKEEYVKAMTETLPKMLNFTQTENEKTLQSLANLPTQIVGNCTWAATEGIVKVFMLLEKIKNNTGTLPTEPSEQISMQQSVDDIFTKWQLYQQMKLLEKYLKHPIDTNLLFQSFNSLWTAKATYPENFDKDLEFQLERLEAAFVAGKSRAETRRFRVNKVLCMTFPSSKSLRHLQAILGTLSFIFSSKKVK